MSRYCLVAGFVLLSLLAGCGGGGGGSTTVVTPPVTGTQITGRVITSRDATGLAGVSVALGPNRTVQATTGADGRFSLTLPAGSTVALLYYNSNPPSTFSVSTAALTNYPIDQPAVYLGVSYPQDRIEVPQSVWSAQTNDLGIITVTYQDPNGPPLPPFIPDDDGGGGTIDPPGPPSI